MFYPYIEQGEIANLPAYNFYMRIAAVEAREPLSGITLLVTEKPNEKIAQKVIESSRLKYGKKIVTKKKAKQKSSKLVEETEQTAEVTVPSGRPTAADQLGMAKT